MSLEKQKVFHNNGVSIKASVRAFQSLGGQKERILARILRTTNLVLLRFRGVPCVCMLQSDRFSPHPSGHSAFNHLIIHHQGSRSVPSQASGEQHPRSPVLYTTLSNNRPETSKPPHLLATRNIPRKRAHHPRRHLPPTTPRPCPSVPFS